MPPKSQCFVVDVHSFGFPSEASYAANRVIQGRNATVVFKLGFVPLSVAAVRVAFISDSVARQIEKLPRKHRTYSVGVFCLHPTLTPQD